MEPTLWNLNLTDWTAVIGIATAALVLAGTGAGVIALRQLRDVRETARDEKRAYVSADFQQHPTAPTIIEFVVQNSGSTAATDVAFDWDEIPVRKVDLGGAVFGNARLFAGIPTLAPGREIRIIFDSTIDRYQADPPLRSVFNLTIHYRDRFGRSHSDAFVLDAEIMRDTNYVGRKSMHEAAESLQQIANDFRATTKSQAFVGFESRADAEHRQRVDYRNRLRGPRHPAPPKRRSTFS
jgi:hypothetical protein